MKVGDLIRVARMPEQVLDEEGDDRRTRQIFELCIGRVFTIIAVSKGLLELELKLELELEVGEVVGEPAYMHSIWIEPDCVDVV